MIAKAELRLAASTRAANGSGGGAEHQQEPEESRRGGEEEAGAAPAEARDSGDAARAQADSAAAYVEEGSRLPLQRRSSDMLQAAAELASGALKGGQHVSEHLGLGLPRGATDEEARAVQDLHPEIVRLRRVRTNALETQRHLATGALLYVGIYLVCAALPFMWTKVTYVLPLAFNTYNVWLSRILSVYGSSSAVFAVLIRRLSPTRAAEILADSAERLAEGIADNVRDVRVWPSDGDRGAAPSAAELSGVSGKGGDVGVS